jgi:major membrane immunogen (membrane-anchored lipoprotein)
MNWKQTATGTVLAALMVTGVACSSNSSSTTTTPAPTAVATATPQATAESADLVNMKGFIAARIAQEKIVTLFADAKSKDGSFILKSIIADSKEKAVKFLTSYVDAALADKLATHYLTDQKADGAIVTNKTPFFPINLLDLTKDVVTFDAANTADLVKFTTKDGVTVTTKKVNDTFVLSDVVKK